MAQYTFGNLLDFESSKIALPSGYTKLNYIENQGNASTYIDTGYIPNQNTKLRSLVSTNTSSMASMGFIGTYRYGFSLSTTRFYAYINTSNQQFTATIQTNTQYLIEIDNITRYVYLNGALLGTIGTGTMNFPIGGNFWIGRLNNYNAEYFNGKIYYNEFLENGISVQKMIPCEDSNGNIGMYDTVTDTFFSNQGTSPFISGGEALTPNYQNGDEIIISSTQIHYLYEDGYLVFWYQAVEPLVFKGITFEQTDYWQIPESVFKGITFEQTDFWKSPESVFRGLSFEITDKVGRASMFHGMV